MNRRIGWIAVATLVLFGCASEPDQANLVKVVKVGDPSLHSCKRLLDMNAERSALAFGTGYSSSRRQVDYDLQERTKAIGGDTLAMYDQNYVPFANVTKASGTAYSCQTSAKKNWS